MKGGVYRMLTLQHRTQNRKRGILPAGSNLRGRRARNENLCLQGERSQTGYRTVCRTVLQRDRFQRMSGKRQDRAAEGPDL